MRREEVRLLFKGKLAVNLALLAILVVGFALRLHDLGKHDLWFDEIITYDYISKPYSWGSQDFINNFIEKNPPLYFILLRQWSDLFGKSEFSLRFLSLFFGVLSIFLLYKLSRIFFDHKTSLLGAVFLSLSPFQIWYCQEARAFTLSLLLSLSSSYFFLRSFKNNDTKSWVLYSFSSLLLLFTTYYAAFILIPQGLLLILYQRKLFFRWAAFLLPPAALFLIFIFPVFAHQLAIVRYKSWLPPPANAASMLETLKNFVVGYNAGESVYLCILPLILGLCLYASFGIPAVPLTALLLFGLAPVILIFTFSKAFFPVYIDRHLIIFTPFIYILLSKGIVSIKHAWLKLLVIVLVIGCVLFGVFNYYRDILPDRRANTMVFLKRPVRPIVEIFLKNRREGDAIGFSNYGFMNIFRHYLENESKEYPAIPKFYFFIPGGDEFFEFQIGAMKSNGFKNEFKFINLEKFAPEGLAGRRIWLFSSSWKRSGNLEPNGRKVKSWFDEHYSRIREWYYDGAWIGIYEPLKR